MRSSPSSTYDDIVVVGAGRHPLRDLYHFLLRTTWPVVLACISATFLALNVLFALVYDLTGGVVGAREHSFRDAFYFSVQTMGTIGYGAMYPMSNAAHSVVVAESVVSVIVTALATGIVFARFSRATSQIVFSHTACIAPMNGVPTLLFRVGNDRTNTLVDATLRVVAIRRELTDEGVTYWRMYDLTLARDRMLSLARAWTVMHTIDEKSPLFGATPESCERDELELLVSVVGTDDTLLQPVHGRHRYDGAAFAWGSRPCDILRELPDGTLQLDARRFHDLAPCKPTASFPYPRLASPDV